MYPFNLETHVISLNPQPHDAISQRRARNAAILHQREVEEEQKEYVLMLKLLRVVVRHPRNKLISAERSHYTKRRPVIILHLFLCPCPPTPLSRPAVA